MFGLIWLFFPDKEHQNYKLRSKKWSWVIEFNKFNLFQWHGHRMQDKIIDLAYLFRMLKIKIISNFNLYLFNNKVNIWI
jgi:hypothetical protein